ncbi:MAG: response regulator [Acidobacteriota bacterium]|nr:response regulator [Acidobacteriota bacterium]
MGQQMGNEARVLVADDDQAIRQLVCTIIKREGLEVDCVADGLEAVEKLKEHEYAVILLDLMMPRLDGFGVVAYLKEHAPSHKPVILVISAYADQKYQLVDADVVSGVLRKPFEVAELGSLVRLCVHGYDAAVERSAAWRRQVGAFDTGDEAN